MPALVLVLLAVLSGACSRPDQPSAGSPAVPAPALSAAAPAAGDTVRLRIHGTRFLAGDEPFHWRGLTAFRLVEMVAHGRESEAVALLDWARDHDVTVVRVLAMAVHLFELRPEEGIAALPRVLELAAARGIHVEVVALADTNDAAVDLDAHVKAAAEAAVAHANALVEIANEPWHPTQDPRLHDPAFVARLGALVPETVPMALGSAESDAGYAAGRYVTWHSPRSTGAEGWEHVLDLANGAALVATWRKPVVSDEPIGAAGEFVGGRRDNAPDRFAAAAALSRLAGLHPTFHYEAGLQARIPAGRELECFEAWRAGLDLVEDLPEGGRFLSATELGRIATAPGARAAFGRQFERTAWVVAVDADASASVTPGAGWRVQQARRLGRLLVARLERV